MPFNTHTHLSESQTDWHLFDQLFAADLHLFVHFDELFRHYFEALLFFHVTL